MELLERGPFLDALAVYAADALSGLGRLAHDASEPRPVADDQPLPGHPDPNAVSGRLARVRRQESGQNHPTP